MQWTERLTSAYMNFPSAPPDYPGAPYRLRMPEPPYAGAPGWQCSVYYFWWEYLRRHAGYEETCRNAGQGEHALLYKHFGDVHAGDFHTWWWDHLKLFTFVSETREMGVGTFGSPPENEGIFFYVGYARSRAAMVNSVREEIAKVTPERMEQEIRKQYRLKPIGRPRLRSLYEHLLVWDAKKNNPDADDAEIADLAGLTGLERYDLQTIKELRASGGFVGDLERANRRAKRLAVQRHLRIAQQYINNVVTADFPMRDGR